MLLRTLGGLRLDDSSLQRSKPLLLLAYLTLMGPQHRRDLARLFWPKGKDARNCLTSVLYKLKTGAPSSVTIDGMLISSSLQCDVRTLELFLSDPQLEGKLMTVYQGPFLQGLDIELSEELEEWVFKTREYLAARVRETLLHQAEQIAVFGENELAARKAETALGLAGAPELEPHDYERVYRLLQAGRSPLTIDLRRNAHEYGFFDN